MKSPARWILIGLLVAGAGLAWGLIPRSEEYSDFGFGTDGLVDVRCGSAFSEDVDPQFRDYEEGQIYRADTMAGYDPPIFEGQTATEVCEDLISGTRTVAIAALAGGALLALVGIVRAAGSSGNTDAMPSGTAARGDATVSGSTNPPPPPPPPSPPPQPSALAPIAAEASPPPNLSPPPASRVTPALLFNDGRHVELDGQIVIGRDPVAPADSPAAALIAVTDETVSKTHLRVGTTGVDVWIEDLHSRNGVSIVATSGDTTTAAPGQRMILDVGDRVVVGDATTFTVADASSAPSGRVG